MSLAGDVAGNLEEKKIVVSLTDNHGKPQIVFGISVIIRVICEQKNIGSE